MTAALAHAGPMYLAALVGALLATGLAAGVLAGLLGVGGGIVVVPVLFHVFTLLGIDEAVRMHVAVGTSLAILVPTSAVSARGHFQRGNVDSDLLRQWGPWLLAGVVAGTVFGSAAKGAVLTSVFAVVALAVAVNMALRPEGTKLTDRLPSPAAGAAIAAGIGAVSAMMGIGGGTLSVPILSLFSYPIRRAVSTAAVMGLIIGIPGAVGFALGGHGLPGRPPGTFGYINVVGFLLIAPMTMISAPFGVRLAHAMEPASLRKWFGLFLFLTSLKMLHGVFT